MTRSFFSRVAPCKDCPFVVRGFQGLRPGRREGIIKGLLHEDASFSCHKTLGSGTNHEDGSYTPGPNDLMCAGALILMKNTYRNGDPDQNALKDNRITRMGLIFGWLDPDNLIDTGVYPTLEEFIKGE